MGIPKCFRKQILASREGYNKDFKRSSDPGKCCFVYLTNDDPAYVAYTRFSIRSLRKALGDEPDVLVLTDSASTEVPEAKEVINVSQQLEEFGFKGVACGRFPDLIFAKFLLPLVPGLDGYDRAVVIDSDTVIQDARFHDLAVMAFGGHPALAAPDPLRLNWTRDVTLRVNERGLAGHPACARLAANAEHQAYINVGLIVWDLRTLRAAESGYREFVPQIADLQRQAEFRLPEQDCFFCSIDVGLIPCCYNLLPKHCGMDAKDAVMVHYTGSRESKRPIIRGCLRDGLTGAFSGGFASAARELMRRDVQRWSALDSDNLSGYFADGYYNPVRLTLQPRGHEVAWDDNPFRAEGYSFAASWDMGDYNCDKALRVVTTHGIPLVLCEAGPVKSIVPHNMKEYPRKFRQGLSVIADIHGFNYDAEAETDLEHWIAAGMKPENREAGLAQAQKWMKFVVDHGISKYNHAPLTSPKLDALKAAGRRYVLVVDQDCADESVFMSGGTPEAFERMIQAALDENPDCTVIVKTHPIQVAGNPSGVVGAYSGVVDSDRIVRVDWNINPYSLLGIVEKVYVQSSAFGFEALMAGKEVHTFGLPWYAGWGATVDAMEKPSRAAAGKRSVEELFGFFYLKYTRWFDPETGERCQIGQTLDRVLALREEFWRATGLG